MNLFVFALSVLQCYAQTEVEWEPTLLQDYTLFHASAQTGSIIGYQQTSNEVFAWHKPNLEHRHLAFESKSAIVMEVDNCNLLSYDGSFAWREQEFEPALRGKQIWKAKASSPWQSSIGYFELSLAMDANLACECAVRAADGHLRNSFVKVVKSCTAEKTRPLTNIEEVEPLATTNVAFCAKLEDFLKNEKMLITNDRPTLHNCKGSVDYALAAHAHNEEHGHHKVLRMGQSKGEYLQEIKRGFRALPIIQQALGGMNRTAHALVALARETVAHAKNVDWQILPGFVLPLAEKLEFMCVGGYERSLVEMVESRPVALTPEHANITQICLGFAKHTLQVTECAQKSLARMSYFAGCSVTGPSAEYKQSQIESALSIALPQTSESDNDLLWKLNSLREAYGSVVHPKSTTTQSANEVKAYGLIRHGTQVIQATAARLAYTMAQMALQNKQVQANPEIWQTQEFNSVVRRVWCCAAESQVVVPTPMQTQFKTSATCQ